MNTQVEEKSVLEISAAGVPGPLVPLDVSGERPAAMALAMIEAGPIQPRDLTFLRENIRHLATVQERDYQWRTKSEQRSILTDAHFPTLHYKFHQTVREQRVHFEESVKLAEAYKLALLDVEELELKATESDRLEERATASGDPAAEHRASIERRRAEIKIASQKYALRHMQIQMVYRIREIRYWKDHQDELMSELTARGLTPEEIWDKEFGEAEAHFFLFLTMFRGIRQVKDGGEIQNLHALVEHAISEAKRLGKFGEWSRLASNIQVKALLDWGVPPEDLAAEGVVVQVRDKDGTTEWMILNPQDRRSPTTQN